MFSADEAVKFVLSVLQVCLSVLNPQQKISRNQKFMHSVHPVGFFFDCVLLLLLLFLLLLQQEGAVEQQSGLTEKELRFDAACQQLASEAVRRGCADNVTVILVSTDC